MPPGRVQRRHPCITPQLWPRELLEESSFPGTASFRPDQRTLTLCALPAWQLTYMARMLASVGIAAPLAEALAELGPRADMPHGSGVTAEAPLGSLEPPRGRPAEGPAREDEAALPQPALVRWCCSYGFLPRPFGMQDLGQLLTCPPCSVT